MAIFYLATTYAAAIACLLASLLLFSKYKEGERSRVILAVIILFSVFNYAKRFWMLCHGEEPELVVSGSMLLTALFMVTSYIMYPIEVISPGYLNFKRILRLYIPWLFFLIVYAVTCLIGVNYESYGSLIEMFPHANQFGVLFRFFLALLFFTPVLFIFFIPYTRRYNNAGKAWMFKYIILFTVNTLAYLLVLIFDLLIIKVLYYYVSVGCSLIILYMELYGRLIHRSGSETILPLAVFAGTQFSDSSSLREEEDIEEKGNSLSEKLKLYMEHTSAYQDPDITIGGLATALNTNRTTLGTVIHELGYGSFTAYINTLRIYEFICRIQKGNSASFQDAFYDVGFRSRTTAIRNFRQIIGMTPSEYFSDRQMDESVDDSDVE